jgi:hypothetical protein
MDETASKGLWKVTREGSISVATSRRVGVNDETV